LILGPTSVVINAMSNSAAIQMLTITEPTSGTNIIFQGSGEGVHMKTVHGLRVVLVTPTNKTRLFTFHSQYQATDTKQTDRKVGKTRGQYRRKMRTISVESEDYRDMDFNDTKAFIICESGFY